MTSIEEFLQEQGRDYFVVGDELPVETLQELTAEYRDWQRETSRPMSGTFLTASIANQVVQWRRQQDSEHELKPDYGFSVVRLEPGDVVVFQANTRITMHDYDKILENMHDLFPNNKVAVLDNGTKLSVLRKEEAKE